MPIKNTRKQRTKKINIYHIVVVIDKFSARPRKIIWSYFYRSTIRGTILIRTVIGQIETFCPRSQL